jgi:hypothetical protein
MSSTIEAGKIKDSLKKIWVLKKTLFKDYAQKQKEPGFEI